MRLISSAAALGVMLAVAVVPANAWSAPATAAEPAAEPTAGPAVATGLVARDGTGIGGADLVAMAWPRADLVAEAAEGTRFPVPVVARTTADAGGRFTLRLDAGSVPASHRRADGQVDLEVFAADSANEVQWSFSAIPSGAAGGPAELTFDLGNRPTVADRQTKAAVTKTARSRLFSARSSRRAAEPDCTTTIAGWHRGLPEMFMKVLAWSGAKATVDQTVSAKHTLGIGVKHASASNWGAGGTSTLEARMDGGASTPGIADAYVWNKVNYRDHEFWCVSRGLLQTKRRPTSFFDLNANFTRAPATFNLRHCSTKLPGTYWKSSGRNVTFGAGVDIGPISVSAQSGYDRNTKVAFVVTRKSKICGNSSSGWLNSSQVGSRKP